MPVRDGRALVAALKADPTVIGRFRAGLMARLKERPDDRDALRRLGQICRSLGALDDARACCERLAALAPDDVRACHAASVLRGRPTPRLFDPHAAMMPPFVYRTDFLPAPSVEQLFEAVAGRADAFHPSGIGYQDSKRRDPHKRQSVSVKADERVRAILLGPVREAIAALGLVERLGVRIGPDGPVEVQVHCHRDGDHFAAHRDGGDTRHPMRELTFVYYFHRLPRRFSGGDLYVYDAGLDPAVPVNPMEFTRIRPAHNSLILFPSKALHEVAGVACDSDDLLDGRLAVTGWMWRDT